MTFIHEAQAAYEWLYTVLSADTVLTSLCPGGVNRSYAQPSTATPYIIIGFLSGSDTITSNAFRILDDLLYQVKVVGPNDQYVAITQAAQRVDALIGTPPNAGSVSGGAILATNRQSPLMMDELVNTVMWTNIGGIYRILVQQIP